MNIRRIRAYLGNNIGSFIRIIYYGNRNKIEKYQGVIAKVYANVFVIRLRSGSLKCFSYKDILTKTIQIYI